jgi:hypothetical protein
MPSCPDLRTPAMLVATGSTAVSLRLKDGVSLVSLTGGTLAVYDATGAAHSTPAVAESADVLSATVTLSGETPGRGWRLDWTATQTGGAVIRLSQAAIVVRLGAVCPVESDDIKRMHPELFGVYPTGQTSWQPQVDAAWAEVQATLAQTASVSVDRVTDPSVLYPLVLRLALVQACRIGRGASGKLAELAAMYQAEYAEMLRVLAMPVDDDGDGLADRSGRADPATWTVDGA